MCFPATLSLRRVHRLLEVSEWQLEHETRTFSRTGLQRQDLIDSLLIISLSKIDLFPSSIYIDNLRYQQARSPRRNAQRVRMVTIMSKWVAEVWFLVYRAAEASGGSSAFPFHSRQRMLPANE